MQTKRFMRTFGTWAITAIFGITNSWAATVDLATSPLVTGLSKNVRPNIFFIFDDSLSMPQEWMPDGVDDDRTSRCFKNFGYNTIYYNPATTYKRPIKADKTLYPNASFTSAEPDGFDTSGTNVNLSSNFRAHSADTAQVGYYYVYTANPTNPPSTCASDASYTRVRLNSTDIPVAATLAAARQNFANWYSYYRTRLLMMKTASGYAFTDVTDQYRVGYTTTSERGTTASKFLGIKTFDSTQRTDWYNILYNTDGDFAGTPLRGALSKAGRYYAGNLVTGANDPVQYSCQKNFTILTTDGFWNTSGESSSAPRYGAYQMNNTTAVGDQDSGSSVARPYRDTLAKSNTLADVAMYYYKSDLRATAGTGGLTDEGTYVDVSENGVGPEGHQHMKTFTLGLGVSDLLTYPSDLTAITQGTKNWPDPNVTNTAITVAGRVDDLWHAAINGRGSYLSAKKPEEAEQQLRTALQSINATLGSSSAAATSNLQPVEGDNTAFIAQYETVKWTGDLLARTIDVGTGAIGTANQWSAKQKLDTMVSASSDTRNIYTFSSVNANKLRSFTSANLATEKAAGYFRSGAGGSGNPGGKLSQYDGWLLTQQLAATDDAMIGYIRGQTGKEGSGVGINTLFRDRENALGDIVNAAPVFVRRAPFRYTDTGYAAFIASTATRVPTVYAGANDGMLHAFDASTGQSTSGSERWAYIPTAVVPNLYKLADEAYSNNHRFYVDGPLAVGDAYSGSAWATILVGGLGAGGKGYYALDVTDPVNPKALWEFGTAEDADIGHSYGNPIITKRASDGKWVVLFASGYNNTSGDRKGRLYVVDAFTGVKLSEIITDNSVNDENLSGIARISNYVEEGLIDNSTQIVYGGDLSGSLWRFDITASSNVGTSVRLARTTSSSTAGDQPITVQPELAKVRDGAGTYHKVVYFGTGRYLGLTDVASDAPSTDTAQGIYAVKDTGAYIGVLTDTGTSQLVTQTLNAAVDPRVIDPISTVDWSTNNGWFVTTPVGERFNVDPGLQLGTLVIASNIPEQDYCKPTGSSVLYQLDYKSGNVLKTNEYDAQIVGITQLQTGGGSGPVAIDPVFGDGTTGNTAQVGGGGVAGAATRVSWREIE